MLAKWRSIGFALLGLLASQAQAATINVGPGQPYTTIQAGITAANNGDTVLVAPGTYYENIDFKGKAITVTSSGGAPSTIIDGGAANEYPAVNFSSGEVRSSVLSGFTVRGGGGEPTPGDQLGGITASGSSPTIRNNVVTANLCSGIYAQSGAALIQDNTVSAVVPLNIGRTCTYTAGIVVKGTAGSGTQILGNTVTQNVAGTAGILLNAADGTLIQGNSITQNQMYGVFVGNTDRLSLIGNLIAGNSSGAASYPANQPSGVYILAPAVGGSTVGPFIGIIEGNTITDTLALDGNLAQFVVVNNIIAGSSASTPPMQCAYSGPLAITPPSFDHNDVWNFAGAAYGPPTGSTANATCPDQTGTYGNISVDPLFVSASTGNYQLSAGSPAIDAGNSSAPLLPTLDFAGSARVQNGSKKGYPVVDMGAYEFAGTVDTGHTNITLTPSEYFASSNPTPVPPPLSLTVTLTSSRGQPTGYAAIYEDSILLGTVDVGSTGTATLTPENLASGLHAFTAVYPAPGSGFVNPPAYSTPAVSVKFFLLVPNSQTDLKVTASPNPTTYGAPVTFTVNSSATNASLTLTDAFTNSVLATVTTNAQGSASYVTSSLAVGSHSVTASFSGSATQSSASQTVVEVVRQASTASSLAVVSPTAMPVYVGTPVTVSATVTSAATSAIPSGTVTIYNGRLVLGTGTLVSGTAQITFSTLAQGLDSLTCLYSGDTNFAASSCPAINVTVMPPAPQTIVFPQPPSPAYASTSVTLAAIASSGLPVTYTVVSGPATVTGSTLTYLGAGTVVVEADQAGSSAFASASPVQDSVNVTLLTEPLSVPSAALNTVVTFLHAGMLATITVTTQGAPGLDFNLASGGTCTAGTVYAAGQTCTANFTFNPQHPGLRFGGIALSAGDGTLLANSYLLGVGTGPQVLYNPPSQTNVSAGFGGLSGVAVDGSGNVYIADYVGGNIYEYVAATGTTRLLTAAPLAVDVAVDGSGNVFFGTRTYVAEILAVNGSIPASPTVRTLVPAGNSLINGILNGLKVDAYGNVFLAASDATATSSSVTELTALNGSIPDGSTLRTLVSGVGGPTGVAIDVLGNVFVSDETGSRVYEIVAVNGTIPASPQVQVVSASLSQPTNVTFDVSGNLYVPDAGTHSVVELLAVNLVLPPSPKLVSLGAGLVTPAGATVDSAGSLYVADLGIGQVVKLGYGAPPTLRFAATPVGATSSDSPKTVTITNGGNADLAIPPPASGTNPSISPSFTIDGSTTCPTLLPGAAAASLAAGASCTTAVNFTPATVGPISGQLVRTDNNLNIAGATQTILLTGNGVALPPTIVFTVPNHTFGDAPFPVAATSNSAGAFTYSVVSGPATIAGSTVTLTGAGTVVLQASQAANGIYAAGSQLATFSVAKEPQTISFPPPASPVAFGTAPITLSATATSGLPVSFSVVSGPGQISGNVLSVLGGGTLVIAANQAGNANFLAAPEVRDTILVTYGPASVVLTGTPNPVFLLNPLTLTAAVTGAGGAPVGTVTFKEGNTVLGASSITSGSASISLSTLSVGLHTLVAYYAGDINFAGVASAPVSITVQDFSVTFTNPNVVIDHGGTAVYNLVVTSIGGVGLASTINLSLAGGPTHAISSFSPAVVTSGSGSTPVTLTVHTPNYPDGPFGSLAHGGGGESLAFLSLGAGALALWRRRRWLGRRTRAGVLALLLLATAGAFSLLSGCGSGWRTQGWTLTVTATSGNLSRSATATLTSECKDGQSACPIY